MNQINLNDMLDVKAEERNAQVFEMYSEDVDISLCSGNGVEGVLVEEDCETALKTSGIDLLISNKRVAILTQNENIYAVDYNIETDRDGERPVKLYHLNFNTLREITSLNKTYVGAIVIGGLISLAYMDTDIQRIEDDMYSGYGKEEFDGAEDDGRIFNGLGVEVKSCYPDNEEGWKDNE